MAKNDWSISFKSTDLPTALDTIAPAITNKTIWGNHLLLRVKGDDEGEIRVSLIANNGLQEIRRTITLTEWEGDERVPDTFELCLPYDPFVRALDGAGGSVNVVVGPKHVSLIVPGPNGPASQATLNVIPNGPVYPEHNMSLGNMVVVEKAGALYKAITLAKVATSGLPSDTIRNAIRLRTQSDIIPHITLEAADSYHAARIVGPEIIFNEYDDIPAIDINLPAQHVGSLKNMAGELWLSADANRVHVKCGKTYWTSVLVEGKFPDINQLAEAEPLALFKIKTAALRNRVRQASAFGNVTVADANVKYSRVVLSLHPDELAVRIGANTSVYGSFSATESAIEAHSTEGEVAINLNAAELLKALSGIDGEEVEVGVIHDGRMISLATEKEQHFIATVLN